MTVGEDVRLGGRWYPGESQLKWCLAQWVILRVIFFVVCRACRCLRCLINGFGGCDGGEEVIQVPVLGNKKCNFGNWWGLGRGGGWLEKTPRPD